MYWLFNLVLYRDVGQSDRSYWSDYLQDVIFRVGTWSKKLLTTEHKQNPENSNSKKIKYKYLSQVEAQTKDHLVTDPNTNSSHFIIILKKQ